MTGYYYLHTNGSLIFKRALDGGEAADFRESDFVVMFWPVDPTDRANAWRILVEATAARGMTARIAELAATWGCDDVDAPHYADHVGFVLKRDGDAWCAHRRDFVDLAQSPAGFGATALAAIAALAVALGWRPQKLWGATFADLIHVA